MSEFLTKSGTWRFNFNHHGQRYTGSGFKTKKDAKRAAAKLREKLENPPPIVQKPTDMAFLELVNLRLDHVKAYNSERHYNEYLYMARRWTKRWPNLDCSQISQRMIETWLMERSKVSPIAANKEVRYLRATFNFGKKKKMITVNPTEGIDFMPFEKRIKYVPPSADIDKIIAIADPDTQDYLWVIRDTLARVSEINRLTWDDVDLNNRTVVLYTRKKKGGCLTPRRVPMTDTLFDILSRRHTKRDKTKPSVFWHRYKAKGSWHEGPYSQRKCLMKTLCLDAGVRHFGFHAMRHAGASMMDMINVPIGAIQRVLGHENRTTTEIYLHSIGDVERLAMHTFEQARIKSHTQVTHHKKKGRKQSA